LIITFFINGRHTLPKYLVFVLLAFSESAQMSGSHARVMHGV